MKIIDSIFTVWLDKLAIQTVNRVPYHIKSGGWGPVNPGRERLTAAIYRLLKGRDVTGIIDCGAFEGYTARTYSQMFPGAIIYAFEPAPTTFAKLQKSLSSYPNIKAINQAVSSTSGRANLFETVDIGSSSLLPPTARGMHYYPDFYAINNQYEVEVTSLDDWWQAANYPAIQFLKLDVQGGELEAFQGAGKLLEKAGVELIQAEVTFMENYSRQCLFSELEIFLRQKGFSLYQFYEIWTHPDGNIAGCDVLFRKS